MKLVLVSTLPLGPLIEVVGVASSRPKVSNFLMALVGSLPPVTAKVFAMTCSSRLPVSVTGRDHAVEVAFGAARLAKMLFEGPQDTMSSCRYCLELRSWI